MISLEEYLTKWSALHGGAKLSLVVRIWLKLSFFLVKPLIRIGVSANAVSILGLLLGVATFLQAKSTLAILWIALSLICDGLDGTIAILRGTNSRFGAVLDSALDRSTEFFWLLALYQIGIQDWLLIIFFLISSLQEYLRARAGGAGFTSVGVVTWSERPVRAIFIFMTLIAYQIGFTNLELIIWIMFIMQVSAFTKLLLVVNKSL